MKDRPKYCPTGEEVKAKSVPAGTRIVVHEVSGGSYRAQIKVRIETRQPSNSMVELEGFDGRIGGGTSVTVGWPEED